MYETIMVNLPVNLKIKSLLPIIKVEPLAIG
jgi:hypothetical protein